MTDGPSPTPFGDRLAALWEQPEIRSGVQFTGVALVFLIFIGILYPAPVAILFLGMVLGSLSALVAMGLVLIYRANRIINFAQGDIGGLAAILAASLIVGPGWPYIPAAIVGLLSALAIGGITEITFIRRFGKAPRLILTVATIGLQQIFAAGQLGLPRLFSYDVAPQPPVPFEFSWRWGPVNFNAGHVLILIVVPLAMAGMAAFFRYTDIGIAVRASAESADRASLLGIPVKRIGTLVWVLAAGLSGLGVLLRLPIQGVSIGDVLGPGLLLRALAAAAIGRMRNLPVTFVAALGLGVMEQAVLFESGRSIIVDAVMFFVILGALLLQRGTSERAEDAGISSWSAVREVRPIPRELARLPIVRGTLAVLTVGVAAFLLFVPLSMTTGTVNLFGAGLIVTIAIISLVVLTGWAGQISLGQLALVAFGASVAGVLAQQGKDFFQTLVAAGLTGAAAAMIIGIPALRIRGLFLAVTTLAFAVTTGTYFLNEEFFPWIVPDTAIRIVRPVIFNKFDLESEHTFYYFALACTLLSVAAVWSLRHSRTGRALVAARDNVRAAQSYGISPVRAQLTAFALSGFLAGLAGGVLFYHQHAVPNTVLETAPNLRIFSVAVIGGLGSIPGALFGATYQTILENSPLTAAPISRLFASGTGLLLILLVLPAGLGGLVYSIRDALLRALARSRDIVVPSLLADVRILEESEEPTVGPREKRTSRPPPKDAILVASDVDVAYDKAQVLFGVDFHVEQSEMVALLGTNGAGKSTLLNAIAGLVTPTGGTVTYEGRDITSDDANRTVAQGIVLMPGARGVFPSLTVEENLRLAGWLYKKDTEHITQATEQVLTYFPVLRERWTQRAGNLSGGEQQMLTLGQVFIAKPQVLMIDELSLGLAPVIVERLLDIVRAINAAGTAVVLVEQSVNIAITLAERAVFLEKGEVRFEGRTSALLDRPDLLRAVFLEGTATKETTSVQVRKDEFFTHCPTCGREHDTVLVANELSVSFGGIQAVSDVGFDIREHQILGIIGPNGAGKTTVFDVISGFVPQSAGSITLAGEDITDLPAFERSMRGLGRSFQDARLFPAMTVRQAIATAFDRHLKVRDPVAAFVLSPAVRASEREVAAKVDELIEQLNLEAFADKFVGELSTGTRRIVDIACSLAHDPKVLLLDEPSSGLAQRETEALGPVLVDIRDRTGAALLVIEHDMPLITAVSDELVALDLGMVIARGKPDDVVNHPAVVEGYLGSSDAVIHRSGARKRKPARRRRASAAKRKVKA